ncbi:MAG: DsrE family protein [Deltaproteobacteria bacterium]
MENDGHLYILWVNDNPITAEKMVFMYGINGLKRGWWDKVTIIIWGATAVLSATNAEIQAKIKEALKYGVSMTACKACADQLEVTPKLEELGIEVKYWGEPLTQVLKARSHLLTV